MKRTKKKNISNASLYKCCIGIGKVTRLEWAKYLINCNQEGFNVWYFCECHIVIRYLLRHHIALLPPFDDVCSTS